MTLLAAWVASDLKKGGFKHSSVYIATDSRYSWGTSQAFDMGQKVFGSKRYPEIFGYVGDVVMATTILTKLTHEIDDGLLFTSSLNPAEKFTLVFEYINMIVKAYPKALGLNLSFVIIHCTRYKGRFYCHRISWNTLAGFNCQSHIVPDHSDVLFAEGSGASAFLKRFYNHYNKPEHNDYQTSRGAFHCFTETLKYNDNYTVGGAAQVVGLYRGQNVRFFGFIHNGKRYYLGKEVDSKQNLNFVEWRNEFFERCDPQDMQLLAGAQRQPKT